MTETQQMIKTGPKVVSRFCIDNILGCLQEDQEKLLFFFLKTEGLKYINHTEIEHSVFTVMKSHPNFCQ